MSNAPEAKVARAKMHAEDKRRTTIVNSMSPTSKKQYENIKKYSDKAAFRNVYETEHPIKSIETSKTDEQVDMKENWKHATYEPLAIIIKKEGGKDDPEACRAGLTIVKKRLAAGFPMCAYNEESERMEYLYFKKGFTEKFIQRKSMATTALMDDPVMLPLISKCKEEGLEVVTAKQVEQAEQMIANYAVPELRHHRADMGAGPSPRSSTDVVDLHVPDIVAPPPPRVPRVVPPPPRMAIEPPCQETLLDEDTQLAEAPKVVVPPMEIAGKRDPEQEPLVPKKEKTDGVKLEMNEPEVKPLNQMMRRWA